MGLPAEIQDPLPTPSRRQLAWLLIACSLAVFGLALAGMLRGQEPFASWFFVFAWWSYIFFLDGATYLRRGSSILIDRPRGFLYLVPWSAAFWLFFEIANLQLANWYYAGLPVDTLSRWLGIFVSFATVLPGVFETTDFLSTFRIAERARCNPETWRVTRNRCQWMILFGVAFLALPMLFPRYFFPLIWGATALLLEPYLAKRGETSLWSHMAAGRPAVPLRILLAGAICGLCWESWNFWASAKWIYTVPFFEEVKLFEMPLLGFLGFPPFALECYTFARFLVAKGWIPEWETDLPRRVVNRRRQLSWALAATLLCIPAIFLVDRFLVRSTAPQVAEFKSLDADQVHKFESLSIRSAAQLAGALGEGQTFEFLGEGQQAQLTTELHLARHALMGHRGVEWLASVNVHSLEVLAQLDGEELLRKLLLEGNGPAPLPSPPEVRHWVRRAK